MLYSSPNPDHPPLFKAVGCICIANHRVLLLERGPKRSYPYHWGLPSGKLDAGETPTRAMVRELYEETGILVSAHNLTSLGEFHIVNAEMSFLYSLFSLSLASEPLVRLAQEHTSFAWFTPDESLELDLVPDLADCFNEAGLLPNYQGSQLDLFPTLRKAPGLDFGNLESSIRERAGKLQQAVARPGRPFWIGFGPPGAGKTTAFRAMQARAPSFALVVDTEPLRKESRLAAYLQRIFFDGDHSYFFKFQVDALAVRFRSMVTVPPHSLLDESIYSNHAYTRALRRLGWISSFEYQTAFQLYQCFHDLLPRRLRILHFTASTTTLMSRISGRARAHEQFYSTEYVDCLREAFADLAREIRSDHQVVDINTDLLSTDHIVTAYGPPANG